MREFRFAFQKSIPILVTYIFLGIGYGVLMAGAGYGPVYTGLSSLFLIAGSLQYIMVPLLASGASVLTFAVMALFVNARHIFYGVGLIEEFRSMGWRRFYMIYALTDETFSLLSSLRYPPDLDRHRAAFCIAMLDHSYWVTGSVLGACAGRYLSFDLRDAGFAATAFFLVMVVEHWKRRPSKVPFLVAAVSAAVFLAVLGKDAFLIPTLVCTTAALLLLRGGVDRKEGFPNA